MWAVVSLKQCHQSSPEKQPVQKYWRIKPVCDSVEPMNQSQTSLFRRIGSSIVSFPIFPNTLKERKRFLLKNFVLHFRPLTVPKPTLAYTLSWGLGGMAALLVTSQLVTGILLKFVYEPFPSQAYLSILHLQKEATWRQRRRRKRHHPEP